MAAAEKIDDQVIAFDQVCDKIESLYEHAENLINLVNDADVKDHEKYLDWVEPLVNTIEDSANTVAENFSMMMETGNKPTKLVDARINSAIERVLKSIDEYKQLAKEYKD